MALTSESGTVDGNDSVIYQIPGTGSARGEGIISYVNYTKGAGDSDITFKIFFKNSNMDDNFYQQVVIDNYALTKYEFTMNATGYYRIPLSAALNEEYVKVEFTGLVDGDINIEFSNDNGYV
jgi:hypothetical protein